MGGIDLRDKVVKPYILETKWAQKWYVKFFRRLLNTAVDDVFAMHSGRNKTYRFDAIKPSFW
jgi:hypothetical protein